MMSAPDNENLRRQVLYKVGLYTYLLKRPGYDAREWGEVSNAFFERKWRERRSASRINAKWRSWLQPLPDVHLYSDVSRRRYHGQPLLPVRLRRRRGVHAARGLHQLHEPRDRSRREARERGRHAQDPGLEAGAR